mgnify:CR=1 FL=1
MQNEFQFFITKIIHGVGSSKKVGDIAKIQKHERVEIFIFLIRIFRKNR